MACVRGNAGGSAPVVFGVGGFDCLVLWVWVFLGGGDGWVLLFGWDFVVVAVVLG